MKTRDIVLIFTGLIVIAALVYLLNQRAKILPGDSTEVEPAERPPADSGPAGPMPESADEPPILYDTETGEGGAAVERRMAALWANASTRQELLQDSGLINRAYQGLKYPTGIKNAMAGIFGSAGNLPIVPDSIEPGYSRRLKEIKNVPNFETLTASQGGDPTEAFATWKNALNLIQYGVNFWPPNIAALIEAGEFGSISGGDRNRSEKYREFTEDMKTFADNLAFANAKIDEIVKDRAIADLRDAGWKFVGYDRVGQGRAGGR